MGSVAGNTTDHPRTIRAGVELYWIPVGAGTSRFQRASLGAWEAVEAARARRRRATLLHSALKLGLGDAGWRTFELAPAFVGGPEPPLLTGPVGFRGADRWRLFRYQLQCLPVETLPDEEYTVGRPLLLSGDADVARRVLELAPTVPPHTWGRRVRGTSEMWTSDSVVSWLLVRAGVNMDGVEPPPGGRAPGWAVGRALAG